MTDKFTVRSVVLLLGAFALVGIAGLIWLIDHQAASENLAIVSGLTGTALGALGAVLVSTRTVTDSPQPVRIEDEPVEVVETKPKK